MSNVLLKNVRLSFNSIFEATDFEGDQNFAYNAKIMIEKGSEAEKVIKKALLEAADGAFSGKGADVIKKVQGDAAQFCLQPHKDDDSLLVLATKRKEKAGRPIVVDVDKSPLTKDDGKPYPGCYVNVLCRPWAMASKGKHWIRCGLEGVQFVKDGEAFGQRTTPDAFPDLGAGDDDDVSTLL